jgi:hypothetical protein
LNAKEPLERRNFTCCHEIAHTFALDASLPRNRSVSVHTDCSTESMLERICDQAAAEMLMPRQFFLPMSRSVPPSIESVKALSRRFACSLRATILRISELAVWPVVFIGWQLTAPAESSAKLRVAWSARPRGARRFVPLHASADRRSGMYATFETAYPTAETEDLHLGSLRGKYLVENTKVGNCVVSVVHDCRLQGRNHDAH